MAEYILNTATATTKLDWAFPFQRTGAFPLDRSSVFSSLEDARLYASKGNDSRGLSGSSYVGQPISVYDEQTSQVTLYIINKDRTLKEVGSAPIADNASIEIVQDKIQLKNFGIGYYSYVPAGQNDEGELIPSSYKYTEGFKEGLELKIVNVDGNYEIAWYEPNPETLTNLENQLSSLIESIDKKADANLVYTKIETDALIAAAGHLKRIKIDNLSDIDTTSEDAESYIYMVLSDTNLDGNDKYDEYMVIDGAIEKVGSWEINLDDYVTKKSLTETLINYAPIASLEQLNNNKVDKQDGYQLIETTAVQKLETVKENAEPNYVKSVAKEFTVTQEGELQLNKLSIGNIETLQEELDKKVNKKTSSFNGVETDWILLSPENQAKLNALLIGDTGNIEISGKVNAENVENLSSWLTENRETIAGLYPTVDQKKLSGIEDGAQKNIINEVDNSEFSIDSNGKLSLVTVPVSKLENLETVIPGFTNVSNDFKIIETDGIKTLNLSKSYVETSIYQAQVGDYSKLVHTAPISKEDTTPNENSSIIDEINYINTRLQWTELE